MDRTRRATLVMIAGSSGLLAVDTLGHSSAELERDVSVDVVSDANAYLGLVDDDVETGGLLFEDGARYPLATFDVVNQLTEPIDVSLALEDERVRFTSIETGDERHLTEPDLGSGEKVGVTIDLDSRSSLPVDEETITTALEIEADGERTHVDAERTLTLLPGVLLVVDLCSFPGWDGTLVLRKRRTEDGDLSLHLEIVDCSGDSRTSVDEIDVSSGLVPELRLSFPEEDHLFSRHSSSQADSGSSDDPSQTNSEQTFESALTTADSVDAELERESTADDESELTANDESGVPVLEVDPDTSLEDVESRPVESVEVRFSELEE
ncbi:hypothetical protein [Natronobacterium texcoconense]|uniref:Uncharacterized protein n=1 Tax=Natronobacterium texcoconense TaxID=1095778 RepID=A0A1H1IMI2_NATTX|nr:hypothetical protein [Natronobacterium texcoconense]SDR38850.1 hypothetical protein SAMN04489842_3628 [Natronobacterium texcoconense]